MEAVSTRDRKEQCKIDNSTQPTPQQHDYSSCGPTAVRVAKLRCNLRDVGHWDDTWDPERLRLEAVELFVSCITDSSVRQSKKRNAAELESVEDEGIKKCNAAELELVEDEGIKQHRSARIKKRSKGLYS